VREQSSQRFGLQPISPPSPQFAPMGDDEGLLIVVAADRRWFPSRRTAQRAGPAAAGRRCGGPGVVEDVVLGWRVQAA
jgi:hypothetical protein